MRRLADTKWERSPVLRAVIHLVPYQAMKREAKLPTSEGVKSTVKLLGCFASFTLLHTGLGVLFGELFGVVPGVLGAVETARRRARRVPGGHTPRPARPRALGVPRRSRLRKPADLVQRPRCPKFRGSRTSVGHECSSLRSSA
jgi:hypothetical protein